MAGHKKLSPSASKRWLMCPGSIKLSEGIPNKESDFAWEGTCAHALAEASLKGSKNPEVYLNRSLEVDGRAFTVTQDMVDAVKVYTEYIKKLMSPSTNLWVETKVNLDWLIPESGGTVDAVIFDSVSRTLEIVDYKHGMGVAVYPKNNTQTRIYALGAAQEAVNAFNTETGGIVSFIKKIRMTIVQPRLGDNEPVKSVDIVPKDLVHWGHNVLVPGANAALSSDRLDAGDHCRFCPAIAICKKQRELILEVAKTDFEEPVFPAASNMSSTDIAKLLKFSEMFNIWVGEVKSFVFEQMQQGKKVDGWKLVAKRSNRKWVDENKAKELMQNAGIDPYEYKILTPAKAEKAFKAAKLDKKAIAPLVFKPDAGVSMAPEGDRRPEIVAPAVTDFIDYEEFDFLK